MQRLDDGTISIVLTITITVWDDHWCVLLLTDR